MGEWITSGRVVRDHVGAGWELWLIASSPLPGRWELRRGRASGPSAGSEPAALSGETASKDLK